MNPYSCEVIGVAFVPGFKATPHNSSAASYAAFHGLDGNVQVVKRFGTKTPRQRLNLAKAHGVLFPSSHTALKDTVYFVTMKKDRLGEPNGFQVI